MYNSFASFFKVVFSILTFLATSVVMGLFNGLVLSVLWRWFVVPVFHLPTFTVLQAWGLAIFLQFVTYKVDTKSDEGTSATEIMLKHAFSFTVTGLISLAVGYVVLQFI